MHAHPPRFSMRSVAVVLVLLGSVGAVLLVTAPTASATVYFRGIISVPTTWGGGAETNYVATGPVTIRPSGSLTVMPGTTVKFDSGVHLFVEGRLTADGTSAKAITFTANNTAFPWGGIQFNASSSGSVSRSIFDRVDRAVTATDSSPGVTSNTILQAGVGFGFVRSSSFVSSNTILRATNVGVYANSSNVQIAGNSINGTAIGIQIEQPSFPTVSSNTITNVSSGFATGILVTAGASASIKWNTIPSVTGGSGGAGGGSATTTAGGRGGDAGTAVAIEVASSTGTNWLSTNTVDSVVGGNGGPGGNGGTTNGNGGVGGDADGVFLISAMNADASGNSVQTVRGGIGGNGAAAGGGSGNGATGGSANGIAVFYVPGSATVHANTFTTLTGGDGGRGVRGGYGGNATGVVFFGNNDGSFNSTQASVNQLDTVTRGGGGRRPPVRR